MLAALLSIHPEYVERIKTGQKRYEYRSLFIILNGSSMNG